MSELLAVLTLYGVDPDAPVEAPPPAPVAPRRNDLETFFAGVAAPIIVDENPITLAIQNHPVTVYLEKLDEGSSRRTMASNLNKVARTLGYADAYSAPWWKFTYAQTSWLRSKLAHNNKPNSTNTYLAGLRGVLNVCTRLRPQLMTFEDMHAALPESVGGSRELAGRRLEDVEIEKLFDACDPTTPIGARDIAMIALLYGCGLRREELEELNLNFVHNGAVRVIGKGNVERTVYQTKGVLEAMLTWVSFRGTTPGPLLYPSVKGGGRLLAKRFTAGGMYDRLQELAKQVGIPPISPHDMRRTFVTGLLDRKIDALTVAKLAGHKQLQTTMRYDRRDETAKREAVAALNVPYRRPLK